MPSSHPGPRFCQGCGRDDFDNFAGSLCPECGDSLLAQGYCPVCERHLPQVPGSLCPKHDLELEEAPPEQAVAVEAGAYVPWITVSVFPDHMTAAILRSRLEAEGIPTILDGERMGTGGMYNVATRGVRLQVPEDRVADARVILSQNWSLPDDEKADFEDLL